MYVRQEWTKSDPAVGSLQHVLLLHTDGPTVQVLIYFVVVSGNSVHFGEKADRSLGVARSTCWGVKVSARASMVCRFNHPCSEQALLDVKRRFCFVAYQPRLGTRAMIFLLPLSYNSEISVFCVRMFCRVCINIPSSVDLLALFLGSVFSGSVMTTRKAACQKCCFFGKGERGCAACMRLAAKTCPRRIVVRLHGTDCPSLSVIFQPHLESQRVVVVVREWQHCYGVTASFHLCTTLRASCDGVFQTGRRPQEKLGARYWR